MTTPPQYDGTEGSWTALEEYGRASNAAWHLAYSATQAPMIGHEILDEVKYLRLLVSMFYAQNEKLLEQECRGMRPTSTYRDEGKRKFQLQPGD